MNYPHYNDNPPSQEPINDDWSYPRPVIKKAMTKARPNRDGNGANRGILIVDPQTQAERWININNVNKVCSLQNGQTIYFHGEGARPSLTVSPPQQPTNNTQSQADYYSAQAQTPINHQQPYQPPANQDYSQLHGEGLPQLNNTNIIETRCQAIANAYTVLRINLPDVEDELITKMAISVFISITKDGATMPTIDNLPTPF